MSTITLNADVLAALMTPVASTPVPAPADAAWLAQIVKIGDTVKSLSADFTPTQIRSLFNDAAAASVPAQVTPAPKTPKAKAVKPAVTVKASVKNWHGKLMLSDAGTASKNQRIWLADNTKLDAAMIRDISMVDASNYRALATGKITAKQYNLLP